MFGVDSVEVFLIGVQGSTHTEASHGERKWSDALLAVANLFLCPKVLGLDFGQIEFLPESDIVLELFEDVEDNCAPLEYVRIVNIVCVGTVFSDCTLNTLKLF